MKLYKHKSISYGVSLGIDCWRNKNHSRMLAKDNMRSL